MKTYPIKHLLLFAIYKMNDNIQIISNQIVFILKLTFYKYSF